MTTPKPDNDLEAALEEQRDRLDQLKTWEHELRVLEEIEAELEVEKISADVALDSAHAKHDFGIGRQEAEAIAESLVRKRELERAMLPGAGSEVGETANPAAEAAQLGSGIEALRDWLGAGAAAARWRRPKLAYGFIAIASVVTITAGVVIHLMLLVLLVPLVMALGYLAFTERDADWIRLGAVRHFDQSRLPPPTAWKQAEVQSRLLELESALADLDARAESAVNTDNSARDEAQAQDTADLALAMELVEANDALESALRKAGIDIGHIDDALREWSQKVHDARRVGAELSEASEKRSALNRSAEETRDAIFRFLALNDAAPARGRADVESLNEGLSTLETRIKGD